MTRRVFLSPKKRVIVELHDDPLVPRAVQKASPSVQKVVLEPVRTGPWSGNNNLGARVPFSPDANNEQTIFKMPEWGWPTVRTVSCGIHYNVGNMPALAWWDVIGLATIGIGGASQEFEFSWLEGTTFSAPMNAIDIRVRYDRTIVPSIPTDLHLSVQIGEGSFAKGPVICGRRGQVTAMALGVPGTMTPVTIPKFARRLELIGTDTLSGTNLFAAGNVLTFDVGGAPTQALVVPMTEYNRYDGGIPIPPFARRVSFGNNTATILNLGFLFKLAL